VFFPIDPGADATIGGMAATRASGTNAVRYGTMKDNVLALKAVLGNGEVITTARRARKSASGYDLTRLLVGSEGTLGVITEITLKTPRHSRSDCRRHLPFPSVAAACQATIATNPDGDTGGAHRMLDALQVKAVNAYSKLALPETPDAVRRIPLAANQRSPNSPTLRRDRRGFAAAVRSNGRPGPRTLAPVAGAP